jgi:hypothetical protein
MIDTLGWPTLAERRLKTRLIMLFKITHALIAIGIQYSFKTLKITYCCMHGYLQKYLHKFHKVKSKV